MRRVSTINRALFSRNCFILKGLGCCYMQNLHLCLSTVICIQRSKWLCPIHVKFNHVKEGSFRFPFIGLVKFSNGQQDDKIFKKFLEFLSKPIFSTITTQLHVHFVTDNYLKLQIRRVILGYYMHKIVPQIFSWKWKLPQRKTLNTQLATLRKWCIKLIVRLAQRRFIKHTLK